MSTTQPLPTLGFCHVGLGADDPAKLSEFYQDVLGLSVVGSSDAADPTGPSAFLSGHPDSESHELVFFQNQRLAHIAFRAPTMADLRAWHARIAERGLPTRQVNHGVSLAFYFHDPEGNMIEIYWRTGLNYGQPYGHTIDLTASEADLLADVRRLAERVNLPVGAGLEVPR